MTNLLEGLYHTVQGIFQSILAVFQSFFNVIYAFVHGVVFLVWNVLESIAEFLGASVHFVISNILVIGLITLGVVLYNDRNKRGTLGNDLKKKAQ
ncbi:hypothetical protein J008_00057 [Cryptococcus neoformans]|uniref:Uncharacterized protein n=2 Tax=Cryptococcus neoformans TaxID=5207 RepID=A0A854QLV8_CRYNE|nr:hypothetical protein CNAG_00052 [Cryptococcus neoformans var. grubii H99]AUB21594.1 hypothetical protein CKF44_00052 [Cryptococcus neoformans var. grubii]OWT41693.1 hypothetical protein C362_00054 [Cryptococcus neoformans var. grubii Bt1]OWZ37432.1 hypothetical protein C347_00123 [Cryptococcus neoformans var. grubii AD2-60a]OWZ48605.1 hypothetical protein C343_00052 [Cryptococcus neoformans var. grubii C23]OWZ59126.1 hypothetical protein C368_00047 [Cryptococcus neoformans var. grubii 125.9|eukprot:XP_012046493.1 hypothetical protein CNAG_00052 [Cryptococcus neoformans var. grubii H99]